MLRIHHWTTAGGMKWPHALELNEGTGPNNQGMVNLTLDDEPSREALSIDLDRDEVLQVIEALVLWLLKHS
jgi:hypothetical protein